MPGSRMLTVLRSGDDSVRGMVPGRRCWHAVTIAPPSRLAEPAGLRATCVVGCYRCRGRTSRRARADPGATGGSAASRCGGLAAGRGLLAAAGHDRHAGFVVGGSAGRAQRGAAGLVVVAAQQQVNRMQPARGRGHDDRDRRPGRTAARPVGNRQRPSQPRQFIVQPGRAVIATMPEPASHVTSITPGRYWPAGRQARGTQRSRGQVRHFPPDKPSRSRAGRTAAVPLSEDEVKQGAGEFLEAAGGLSRNVNAHAHRATVLSRSG